MTRDCKDEVDRRGRPGSSSSVVPGVSDASPQDSSAEDGARPTGVLSVASSSDDPNQEREVAVVGGKSESKHTRHRKKQSVFCNV